MKIADQVSRDAEAPTEDAVANDPDLQGVEELGNIQSAAPEVPPATETAALQVNAGDVAQEPGTSSMSVEFAGAQLGSAPRFPAHAKLPVLSAMAHRSNHTKHSKMHSSKKKAAKSRKQLPEQAAVDAANAHEAAETAKQAAKVANQVAQHSVHLTEHAKSALKSARDALHKARVDSHGLSSDQKDSLQDAESRLKEATKETEYGAVKEARYAKTEVKNKDLDKMEEKLQKNKTKPVSELNEMRQELKTMREKLKKKTGREAGDGKALLEEEKALMELEDMIRKLEEEEAAGKMSPESHDELKVEVEKLHDAIDRLEVQELEYTIPQKSETQGEKVTEPDPEGAGAPSMDGEDSEPGPPQTPLQAPGKHVIHELPASADEPDTDASVPGTAHAGAGPPGGVTPLGSMDVDTQMPYGDLEPFGREDTAQELTEASIHESDAMVDQLERAEVAEEKRAVFRALTRLRGAAITSFDGVARSQTGNIDEYNKIHKWRSTHPLHHLADEESDISKWAFPDNADF
mmetsp:Transcript_127979/g.235459  ORF Transcript_127979/g.235459 Transcript_127979/m.235459 type:complete len:519 (+) Transcript_127979:57-1613(+)